ncbi:MAG: thiamine pyrophosphate-dependent dehydrogenase E1 component subunit alpha [Armatimonadetes bacterium]|nr:thiamine pyrophosphate-dependent dehydrogenase E1 component subunit alpha [Armatimonadota bacterium]
MLRTMALIRAFEDTASRLYKEGRLPGFLHLYIGEEAVAAGACANLRPDDYITSTHRGHGHVIAKGADVKRMMAELFAKKTGYCRGKGGSMHIFDFKLGVLGANGIVGGGIPIATGAGLSIKLRKTDQVAICFFGDGASNQGSFHESLNIAAVFRLPVIYLCENNCYALSTPQRCHQAVPRISDRASAYGMPGMTVDGQDVLAVYEAVKEAVERARSGGGPTLIEATTYRISGHHVGDSAPYRSSEELEYWRRRDPIEAFQQRLISAGIISEGDVKAMRKSIEEEMAAAVRYGEESPSPNIDEAYEDVFLGRNMHGVLI